MKSHCVFKDSKENGGSGEGGGGVEGEKDWRRFFFFFLRYRKVTKAEEKK